MLSDCPFSLAGNKMKRYFILVLFILFCRISSADESNQKLNLTCQDYSWSDVELLVSPYLDDTLFTALVMQGQSANYKTSLAAIQAMDKSLPDLIRRILQSLIDADC